MSRGNRSVVAVLCPGGLAGPGGIAALVREQVAAWDPEGSGLALKVLDPRGNGSALWSPFRSILVAWSLWRMASRNELALVHIHMASWGSMARKGLLLLWAKWLDIPALLHLHASDYESFLASLPRPIRRAAAATLRAASRIVVVGGIWRDEAAALFGIDEDRLFVVQNAVRIRNSGGESDDRPDVQIAFLGRFEIEKGIWDLLAALADRRLADLPWRATMAGGPVTAPLRRFVETHDLAKRVDLIGWLEADDAARLLAHADIFVLPSHREAMPLSLLEAMAEGCAIVVCDVGAVGEVASDGKEALLVPPQAPKALATALFALIDDRELRRRLGDSARRRQREAFEIDDYCRRMATYYRALLPDAMDSE